MTQAANMGPARVSVATLAGIGAVSAALLMTELALTRIFSVTMYYHFAFMVISLALLGLAVSGVGTYLLPRLFRTSRAPLLASIFALHRLGRAGSRSRS